MDAVCGADGGPLSDAKPFNPIIKDKYTADPTALVVGDSVYLYTGHDEAPKGQARYVIAQLDLLQQCRHDPLDGAPKPHERKRFYLGQG